MPLLKLREPEDTVKLLKLLFVLGGGVIVIVFDVPPVAMASLVPSVKLGSLKLTVVDPDCLVLKVNLINDVDDLILVSSEKANPAIFLEPLA